MEFAKPRATDSKECYKRAQSELEFTFLDGNTQTLIDYLAKTTGVCKEYFLLPLLAAVTGCMNSNTDIRITSHWAEKVAIWCLVGARRGERKTTVMRRFKAAFDKLNFEAKQAPTFRSIPGSESTRVMLDEFSLRDVDVNAKLACQTDNNVVMLDDFGLFTSSVKNPNGKYSNLLQNTPIDAVLLNLLFDGGYQMEDGQTSPRDSLSRDTSLLIPQFNVSFAGLMDATDLMKFVDNHSLNSDFSSCVDRLLICCPRDSTPSDLDSSVTPFKASLYEVLTTVKAVHKVNRTSYIFSSEGQTEFDRLTKHYLELKNKTDDERCRGSLGKAPGLLARLSAALTALRNGVYLAIHGLTPSPTVVPSPVISMATVIAANSILAHTLQQKFTLFGEESSLQIHCEQSPIGLLAKQGGVFSSTAVRPKYKSARPRPASKSPNESIKSGPTGQFLIQNVCSLTGPKAIKRERQTPPDVVDNPDENFKSPKLDDRVLVFDTACMEQNQSFSSYTSEEKSVSAVTSSDPIEIDDDSVDSTKSSTPSHSGGMRLRVTTVNGKTTPNSSHNNDSSLSIEGKKTSEQETKYIVQTNADYANEGFKIEAADFNSEFTPAAAEERTTRFGMLERPTDQKIALEELSDDDFILLCKPKIKKFLLHPQVQISCGHACQRRLFPGVPKHLRLGSQSTSHPGWAALLFFNRLEELGFGYVCKRGGSFKAPQFMKYPLSEMTTEAKNVLNKIGVTEEEYESEYPNWSLAAPFINARRDAGAVGNERTPELPYGYELNGDQHIFPTGAN